MTARTPLLPAVLVAALLLGACSSGAQSAAADLGGTLERLPECGPLPAAVPHEFPLPGSVVLTNVTTTPMESGTGVGAGTPGEVVEAIAGQGDIAVIWSEDEGFEAEVLIERAGTRVFVRVYATCAGRSSVEVRAASLATP